MRIVGTMTALAALTLLTGTTAGAQEAYPTRSIEMIIPAPPGGGLDAAIRILAEEAEAVVKQKFVFVYKPGGGGSVGSALITQARPDGYTIGAAWHGPITAVPHTLKVPYEVNEYTPIIAVAKGTYVYCVDPDFPATDGKSFIDALKANPGKYTYGHDGVGGVLHLETERIARALGIRIRGIPYSGSVETAKNFLGGHVAIYTGSVGPIIGHMRAGKAKCLLQTSNEDSAALPQAATLKAIGAPELETTLWRMIFGPKGLPADKVKVLEDAFRTATKAKRFRDFLEQQGDTVEDMGPEPLKQMIATEYKAFGEVATELGIAKK